MSNVMKALPFEDRPRERLLNFGPKALSNSELLAILIRTGTSGKSALNLASEVLLKLGGVRGLTHSEIGELKQIKGIGKSKACQIIASLELARRINCQPVHGYYHFTSPADVYDYVIAELAFEEREHFIVVGLNTKNYIIGKHLVSVGTLNQTLVHPREVFSWAIKNKCAAIIVVHNHPSGLVKPSDEDIKLTQRILEAGKIIGIELLDHVIVSRDNYYSLKANQDM